MIFFRAKLGIAHPCASCCFWNSNRIGQNRERVSCSTVRKSPSIQKRALALGLAFHELATNAAKYGALSKPAGQVRVVWDVLKSSEPSTLRLKWMETGGPPVKKDWTQGIWNDCHRSRAVA